jgi:hypothetical protein
MKTKRTSETPVEAARAVRDELLARGWPTSDEVGRANGATANPGRWAKDKQDADELLGVWSARERTWRHPTFQFTNGLLNSCVKELLAVLALHSDLLPANDRDGWRRAFWLHGVTRGLAGADGQPRAAIEVFLSDPDAVIKYARNSATVDPNIAW